MKKLYFLLCFSLLSTQTVWSQWPPTGGPDPYGYEWKTNTDENGPAYEWIDITGVGTEVSGLTDDNVIGPVSMGIDFQYYWNTRSSVWIGSNGFLSFQIGNIASTSIGFPPTPTPSNPNDVIAPFMCDLNLDGAGNDGKVYYYSDNQNQRFIVSYIDVPFWNSTTDYVGANTFQVILDSRDSTVTFQYQKQQGNWEPTYDSSPNPMVVGIENITGNIGLMVSNLIKPTANTSVRFYAPAEAGLSIGDVAPISLQTFDNTASFVPYSASLAQSKLTATVGNLGNIDLNFPTEVLGRVRDSTGQLFFQQQVAIPTLAQGEVKEVNFTAPFIPLEPGPYTFSVELSNPADINSGNNVREVEIIAVDTSMETVSLSYSSENPFSTGTAFGFAGGGVKYEFFGYPLIVKALEFLPLIGDQNVAFTSPIAFIAEMYDVDPLNPSQPGRLLFREEIPTDSIILDGTLTWTSVKVPISQGVIPDNGFFMSFTQVEPNLVLFSENTPPFSRKTYEIIDGTWAEYRSNNSSDIWMRAVVDISNIIITNTDDKFENLNRFNVYPNPTSGKVQLELELTETTPLMIKILDMQGRKIKVDMVPNARSYQQTYDLSYLPKGVYLIQISTSQGQKTKKVILE